MRSSAAGALGQLGQAGPQRVGRVLLQALSQAQDRVHTDNIIDALSRLAWVDEEALGPLFEYENARVRDVAYQALAAGVAAEEGG